MREFSKRFFQPIALIVALIAICTGLIVYSVLAMASDSSNSSSRIIAPNNMIGHWHQVKIDDPSMSMSAEITDGGILITLRLGDKTGTYWDGTFDTKNTSNKFTTLSIGNKEALDSSLFGSLDSSKMFAYKNGDLSYKFSIAGVSSIIHLQK